MKDHVSAEENRTVDENHRLEKGPLCPENEEEARSAAHRILSQDAIGGTIRSLGVPWVS